MQNPLQAHIIFLEQTLQELLDTLTSEAMSIVERARIEARISFANRALVHYRRAVELETALRSSDANPAA